MQMGFYFDQTRCTGCYTCVVACKDWHDIPAGPANWIRIETIEKGRYPDVYVGYLVLPCFHCEQPACIPSCPVGAINKRETDGVTLINSEICLGKDECNLCLDACLYHAPQFGTETNAKMQKCNLCIDRLDQGKKPICVDACPMRALDAAPLPDLKREYGETITAVGFAYDNEIKPAICFKPKSIGPKIVPA